MSNLFIRHFTKVLETNLNLNLLSTTSKQLKSSLASFRTKYDPRDYTILHRFPRKDIKTIVGLPCPIVSDPSKALIPSEQTISSMKNLRLALDIREFRACSKCPVKDSCSFKDQVPESQKANLTDLMVALVGLAQTDPVTFAKMVEEVKKAKNDATGEKPTTTTNAQEANEKETTENKETTQEKKAEPKETAEKAKEEKEGEAKNKEQEGKTEEAGASVDYLKFKYWNSGLKVLDSLSVILEDLNQNNGMESRRFINTFLEELTKAKHAQKESQKEHFKYKQAKEGKQEKAASDDESESSSEKEKEEDGSESEAEEKPKGKGKWNQRDDRFPKRNDRFSGDSEGKPFRNNRDRPGKFGNEGRGGDRFNNRNDRFDGNRRGKFGEDNERPEGNRRGQSWGNDRNDRRPPWKNRDGEGENTFRKNRSFDTRDPRPRRFNNDDEGGFKGGFRKRFDRSEPYEKKFEKTEFEKKDKFYEPEAVQNEEKFMRSSNREFKKFDRRDEKPTNFRKKPQRDDFPIVEKDDMLLRKKNRRETKGKDSNFEFTETDADKKKNE